VIRITARYLRSLALVYLVVASTDAWAAPARSITLFPKDTLAYLRLSDVHDTVARFNETGMGRMLQDPGLQPHIQGTYNAIKEAAKEATDQLDMSLDDLLAIFRGEVAAAFLAREQGEPGLVVLVEARDRSADMRKLLARVGELMQQEGGGRAEETIDGQVIASYSSHGRDRLFGFERDETFVFATDLELLKTVLAGWNGRDDGGLVENPQFAAIMKSCKLARDEMPQIVFYADPIGIARTFGEDGIQRRTALAILPVLGLDGFHGVGGAMTLAVGEFDSITHLHFLMPSPRSGVLEAIALEPGDLTPQPWVPSDVAQYMTLYWNFETTYKAVEKLVDGFQGHGATANWSKIIVTDRIGADLATEIIPQLSGRVTLVSHIMKPVTINSAASLYAIELNDAKEFEATFQKMVDRISQIAPQATPEKKAFGSTSYYRINFPTPPNYQEGDPLPEPVFSIAHDCLLFSDREAFLKQILSPRDEADSLASQLDFKLIASKIQRQSGAAKPGMISFVRPEESMRYMYDLANAEQMRNRIAQAGERNKFVRSLGDVLEKNPLPPFSTLEKYMSPAGSSMTIDETGLHYVSFSLMRK
jgi:hypothetical protein